MAWSSVRHFHVRGDGVVLLFDPEVTALSPLRGVYLRWGTKREAVLANLEYYLPGRIVAG
jgi:hypothetical protein